MRLHQANVHPTAHSFPMDIRFPGGLRVDALHEGFWIRTDQPVSQGGSGAAPSPFDLFLASIGACAGFYALRFCQQRNLNTEGLSLSVTPQKAADDGKRVARIRIEIALPPEFPEKYREAILRAVDQCSVKRHLAEPPQFDVFAIAARQQAETPPGTSPVESIASSSR